METKRISKQVIILREEFIIDGEKIKPRKGKFISQGSHACLKAIFDLMKHNEGISRNQFVLDVDKNSALNDWILGRFTKICLSVKSEQELLEVYNKAKEKGLICSLITDAGLTEFKGISTNTAVAIGPNWSDEIDEITGKLSLFS